jgi:hypothetical protein
MIRGDQVFGEHARFWAAGLFGDRGRERGAGLGVLRRFAEVIAPPSNAAATSRSSMGAKLNKSLLSVGIGALREIVKNHCRHNDSSLIRSPAAEPLCFAADRLSRFSPEARFGLFRRMQRIFP